MRVFEALNVGWLGGPFAPADTYNYAQAKLLGNVPLAAGENHYTRHEFTRVIEDRCITILQPDVSKTGGVTELMRIAAMASGWKIRTEARRVGKGGVSTCRTRWSAYK